MSEEKVKIIISECDTISPTFLFDLFEKEKDIITDDDFAVLVDKLCHKYGKLRCHRCNLPLDPLYYYITKKLITAKLLPKDFEFLCCYCWGRKNKNEKNKNSSNLL